MGVLALKEVICTESVSVGVARCVKAQQHPQWELALSMDDICIIKKLLLPSASQPKVVSRCIRKGDQCSIIVTKFSVNNRSGGVMIETYSLQPNPVRTVKQHLWSHNHGPVWEAFLNSKP